MDNDKTEITLRNEVLKNISNIQSSSITSFKEKLKVLGKKVVEYYDEIKRYPYFLLSINDELYFGKSLTLVNTRREIRDDDLSMTINFDMLNIEFVIGSSFSIEQETNSVILNEERALTIKKIEFLSRDLVSLKFKFIPFNSREELALYLTLQCKQTGQGNYMKWEENK